MIWAWASLMLLSPADGLLQIPGCDLDWQEARVKQVENGRPGSCWVAPESAGSREDVREKETRTESRGNGFLGTSPKRVCETREKVPLSLWAVASEQSSWAEFPVTLKTKGVSRVSESPRLQHTKMTSSERVRPGMEAEACGMAEPERAGWLGINRRGERETAWGCGLAKAG